MIESISQLGLTFFGLTSNIIPEVRSALFKQIHEIVFHGKGGFDWHTVYNMPIWLRKFTFKQIQDFYDEENNKSSSSNNGKKTMVNSDGTINTPEFTKTTQQYKSTPSYK
jgi:hypothetical protein